MVVQLNSKYKQAVKERESCLSLTETLTKNKIPNSVEMITYYSLRMKDSVAIEYPDNYFNDNNLLNSNYNDLTFHDFEKYYYLAKLSGYSDAGKGMLKILLQEGRVESPVLIKGKNEIYWQLMGNLQMMAYKVLGIFPIVKEIPIEAKIVP